MDEHVATGLHVMTLKRANRTEKNEAKTEQIARIRELLAERVGSPDAEIIRKRMNATYKVGGFDELDAAIYIRRLSEIPATINNNPK